MAINIEVDGNVYSNFISASVTLALDTLANDFNFEAAAPDTQYLPFKGGEACTILIDDEVILTGFIETVSGSHSANSHAIAVSGRDRTGDFIDSTLGPLNDIRAPITLKQLIERVLAHLSSDLSVIDAAAPEVFNNAEDIVSATPGDNAFSFVEGYAQKRQVLLTSNADGDIVITNSAPGESSAALQHVINADGNNVLSAAWSTQYTGRFNKYIQLGQQDPLTGNAFADNVVEQSSTVIDSAIRAGRQHCVVADKGFSKNQLRKRAEWSKKIREARSTMYSATVQGHRDSEGVLWGVNRVVSVVDNFADIDRRLLINTVTFSYSSAGSTTTLGFVEENAYKLTLQEPVPVGTDQDAFKL